MVAFAAALGALTGMASTAIATSLVVAAAAGIDGAWIGRRRQRR